MPDLRYKTVAYSEHILLLVVVLIWLQSGYRDTHCLQGPIHFFQLSSSKIINFNSIQMGSQNSEPSQSKSLQSEWHQYESYLSRDKDSQIQPFTAHQMTFLEQLFSSLDRKKLKSIELKDLQEVTFLREHVFYPRFVQLFEEEMKKTKAKRINFELFLYLLSTFHFRTELEDKYKYLFRLYDIDKNMKIDANDLNRMFRIIYANMNLTEEDYSKIVTEALIRYGSRGEIKIQQFREMVPEDQVREVLTFRFKH